MAPTLTESTPAPTPDTTQVETPSLSPQETNRQALYEQYYGTPAGEAPPAEVVTPPADSVAPTEQVVAPTPPAAVTLPPEVIQLMQSMQAELAAVKSMVAPQPPPVDPNAPTPEAQWVRLLREGKTDEAISAMAELVGQKNTTSIVQQAMAQTREVMRAEADIDRFTTEIRVQNADLLPMERFISAEVTERVTAARNQGLIKTTDDAIREYKKSVTEAVSSARKLYQTLRGDGKTEAQTRNREVLSSRPISPQQVDTARPQLNVGSQEAPVESPMEYLEKRRAVDNWKKGLAPKPNFL